MATYSERMHLRARILRATREFFVSRGFLEVDTPVAISAPAPEPHLEAPAVQLRAGDTTARRFLQTSPELPMKRLLVEFPTIFQLAASFRDGDLSERHRPEFRLLEWYRRGAPYEALLDDCEALLVACATAVHGEPFFTHRGARVELSPPFQRITMEEAFLAHAGFSILAADTPEALRARLSEAGVHFAVTDSWDELFHRVFLSRVEPALIAGGQPLFLTHYPAPLAALARACPADPRVSERFELYVAGLELANGFGELVDAVEQRRRFEADRALRRASGQHDYPFDERFFTALAKLPPSAGIALGFERLVMALLDASDLDEVSFIPWSQT